MKQLFSILALSFLLSFASAQGTSKPRSTSSASRPVYHTPTHTQSHGGTYVGGSGGSSHQGAHYTAPNGYKGYGTHSKK